MESNLPKGWISVSPLEVAEKIRGVSYAKEDVFSTPNEDSIPVLRANAIEDDKIIYEDVLFVKCTRVGNSQFLQQGDILIAMSSGSKNLVGKAAQYFDNKHITFGAFCGVLRPSSELNARYFGYFFRSREYRNTISELAAGTNINNLKNEHFESLRIPIAPIKEQQRIVAKLDELMEKIDRSRARLERIPKILKRFRQSVLSAAVNGKLTEQWREINKLPSVVFDLKKVIEKRVNDHQAKLAESKIKKLPKPDKPNYLNYSFEEDTYQNDGIPSNWIVAKVGLLCDCIVPGRDKPKSFTGAVPWITLPEINGDELDGSSCTLKLSEAEISEVNARVIPKESVIMCCVGKFGISAVVKTPIVINQQLHAFTKSEVILPKYLMYHLKTLENYQNSIATSTTISYLNKTNCNSLPINLPPVDEQKQIVQKVDRLLAFADKIEARYHKAKAALDKFPQSLLAKAYRGELVAQDERDESARDLLKRIESGKKQSNKSTLVMDYESVESIGEVRH